MEACSRTWIRLEDQRCSTECVSDQIAVWGGSCRSVCVTVKSSHPPDFFNVFFPFISRNIIFFQELQMYG